MTKIVLFYRDDQDKTALFLAAEKGWLKTLNILLGAEADVSFKDNTEVRL